MYRFKSIAGTKERTEQIAFELYQRRERLGRDGTADSDWEMAVEIVNNPFKTLLFIINRPLILMKKPWSKFLSLVHIDQWGFKKT